MVKATLLETQFLGSNCWGVRKLIRDAHRGGLQVCGGKTSVLSSLLSTHRTMR